MTDQELKDLVASLAVSQPATAIAQDRTDQDIKDLIAGFAAAQAKADAQIAKTDAQMAKTDAQIAKTDEKLNRFIELQNIASDKTDAKLNRLSELYGGVADNQGSAAEEFFFNSLKANPIIGNITYDRVTPNLVVGKPGKRSEFDLVLVNGNCVALIEVKHKAHLSALDQLDKQLQRYRALIPEHASYTLYGGIAGLSVPEATIEEAHKRGMFVLKQQGDVFAVDVSAMRGF